MRSQLLKAGVIMLMLLVWCPAMSMAVDNEPIITVTPFVEYSYQSNTGSAEDVLDRINDLAGGWLRGYKDVDLFQHLLLVGAEVRLARPELPGGLKLFASLAGTAGSTGMLGEDYDRGYDLRAIPIIPGVINTDSIPFINIDGRVRLQVNQYLDYYIPLQVGVRYEPHPDRDLCFFGAISGGVLFYKGGMDIDVDMSGTMTSFTASGETTAAYRGEIKLQDIGWIASAMAGMRYHWNQDLSSSVALGLGFGRLNDNVNIGGDLNGHVTFDSLLIDIDTPFSINLDNRESISLKTDGWRLRLGILELKW